MKEDKKSNNQHIYKIRIYKDFEFPSFSVDKNKPLEDLSYMAMQDFRENYKNDEYYKFEIVNVLPFTLETTIEETTGVADYDFMIREIALQSTKERFGELDYEKNPSLFRVSQKLDTSVTYALIPEIENYFVNEIKKNTAAIRNKIIRRPNEQGIHGQPQPFQHQGSGRVARGSNKASYALK